MTGHPARAAARTRARLRLVAALLASWLLGSSLYGCARCNPNPQGEAIATLSKTVGSGVTRDFAAKMHEWVKAELGAQLALGDGAQTDGQSTAELTFVDGSGLSLKPNTVVRLLPDEGERQTAFDIQAGEAILRVGARGLALRTHVGLATIAENSEIVLRRDGNALGFAVALGRVNFRDKNAADVSLATGDSVAVGIGMAVLSLDRAADHDDGLLRLEVVIGEARAGSGAGQPLGKGTHVVSPNTPLRLPDGAEVLVRRGAERVRLRGAGDFTVGLQKAIAESRRGSLTLEADEVDVEVHVPGGVIIARRGAGGSSTRVDIGPAEGHLRVLKGGTFASLIGHPDSELSTGQERTWRLDGSSEVADAPQQGPSYRNMTARAGDSFVVHTPSAPVAIGFEFASKCGNEGQLELQGGRQVARGTGIANLAFAAGSRGYTLRCVAAGGALGKVVARGNVQVLIDAGTRRLPAKAPTSTVDADGRTYSIYYQNQLPEVIARWPNPPQQKRYRLELDGKVIELSEPQYLFKSGALGDGSHALAFQAEGRRSRTTTVEVRFDNVAPKASLSAPEDRGFTAGEEVTVEGVALPTWKVALEGGTIAMSSGDRFSGRVKTDNERPDVAVRLNHPRLGTHYYLRRASGSP